MVNERFHNTEAQLGLGTIFAGKRGETVSDMHELIPELHVAGQFIESPEYPSKYSLVFVLEVEHPSGALVRDVRIFTNVDKPLGFEGEVFELSDSVLEDIGFSFSSRVYQSEMGSAIDVEKRFKITRRDTNEIQTVTIGTADHWQNSHSHRSYIEQYTLSAGTIKLVEDHDGEKLKVTTISKTETGHHICEEIFDAFGNKIETLRNEEVSNFSYIATETDKPHNVWVSHDAILGTVKQKSQTKDDWHSDPLFDERIRKAGL